MGTTTTAIDGLPAPDGNDAILNGDDQIRALAAALDGRLHSPGDIKWSIETADHGKWKLCDGRNSILRTAVTQHYIDLALALGLNGSDSSHIGLPNIKRKSPIGADPGGATMGARAGEVPNLGATGGEETHNLSASEMPQHTHPITDPGHIHSIADPGHSHSVHVGSANNHGVTNNFGGIPVIPNGQDPDLFAQFDAYQGTDTKTTGISVQTHTTGITEGNAGGNGAHNNVQPWIALNAFVFTG